MARFCPRANTCLLLVITCITSLQAADGDTRIATWSGDKQAAFILMFDDSLPSHVQNVIPLLAERGLPGTFYINPATGHYKQHQAFWENDAVAAGMELGNHTMTHKGITDPAQIEAEIGGCNAVIQRATPDQPWPRTISWAKPGVKKHQWTLSAEQLQAACEQYHLQQRPGFGGRGAAIHLKTSEQMLAHVDRAIASKSMECIIFHGVGGDWISVPTAMFRELLDGLAARSDRVWVCSHTAALAYAAQRDASTATVDAKRNAITVNLASQRSDDTTPLTLCTAVPKQWKHCLVKQGETKQEVDPVDGLLTYDAIPGAEPIRITKR